MNFVAGQDEATNSAVPQKELSYQNAHNLDNNMDLNKTNFIGKKILVTIDAYKIIWIWTSE